MAEEVEFYIVIAQQEWSFNLGSNARNLAIEFSRRKPVLYINPPLDFKSAMRQFKTPHGKKRLKLAMGMGNNTVQADENIWVHTPSYLGMSISWIKNTGLFNAFNRLNARSFFGSLKKAIRSLGWKENKCVVLNDSQMFVGQHTKEYLKPLLSFYYIRDNLVEHPYFKYHGSRVEPHTIRQSDAVFANSAYLADYAGQYHSLSKDIGQGCELDMYDASRDYDEPQDLAAIPHPRIGYIGFLTGERLDIPLLEELATRKKEWNWVFIGPEEIMFQQSRLHGMPNVFFTGSKKPEELPAFTKHLDVCINPQLINALTIGNYPRKIDEYLAMGKPTVATNTPAMNMFLPHVHLAEGPDGYIKAIEKALETKPAHEVADAIGFAKGHTWQASAEKIFRIQEKLLHERKNKIFTAAATHSKE